MKARGMLGTAVVLACVTGAGAQVLRPTSDNRNGQITVDVVGFGEPDPIDAGYNIDPGFEYLPIDFNQTVQDSGGGNVSVAALDTQSAYVGYNQPQNSFTSLRVDSLASAQRQHNAGVGGFAIARDNLNMDFRVEGLGGGGALRMLLWGSITKAGVSTATLQLTGPGGLNLSYSNGAFNKALLFTANGDYQFRGQTSLSFTTNGQGTARLIANLAPLRRGDMNCDGAIDFADINPFVLAQSGQAGYSAQFPSCFWDNADINTDGQVNFDDINPFVGLLTSGDSGE